MLETKTNYKNLECIFSELPKVLLNRVEDRIEDGDEGERVKHISKRIKQDGSFNSLMLDELARVYAIIGSYYDAIESGLTKENFIDIYVKDNNLNNNK